MSQPPNLLVFLTDDHGQWALGTYGNRELQTPNLDYLARTGVQMANAFTPTPVCSPARACFLTGRLASQHGIHDYIATRHETMNARDWMRDEKTLVELLSEAGYQTGLAGKWHLGHEDSPQPGFDYWFSIGSSYPVHHGGTRVYSENGVAKELAGYTTQIITDHAVTFLRDVDPARPFFLLVGYTATHSPWSGQPQRFVDLYRDCRFTDIPDDAAYPFGRQNLESTTVDRSHAREALRQYYAGVTHLDAGVGRLLDVLEAQDLRRDTLIVYTSDHGLNCGHHGIWGKGNGTLPYNMVEESIRVPLIFNHPGHLLGGQRRVEFVDHLDVFQTLLDYAGIRESEADRQARNSPGRSFLPVLKNTDVLQGWRQRQFGEYGNLRMVRTLRHKLIRRFPAGPCELFDLKDDPRELINLFDDPDHQQLAAELTAYINAYFSRYEDPQKSGLRVQELPRHNLTEAWRAAS